MLAFTVDDELVVCVLVDEALADAELEVVWLEQADNNTAITAASNAGSTACLNVLTADFVPIIFHFLSPKFTNGCSLVVPICTVGQWSVFGRNVIREL